MQAKLVTVGQIIKRLGNKISVTDKQTDVAVKSGINIISTIPSGRGTTIFIDVHDEKKMEEYLFSKYSTKHTQNKVLQVPLKDEIFLNKRINNQLSFVLSHLSDMRKEQTNFQAHVDKRFDLMTDVFENMINLVLTIHNDVVQIRDIWKTEEKTNEPN